MATSVLHLLLKARPEKPKPSVPETNDRRDWERKVTGQLVIGQAAAASDWRVAVRRYLFAWLASTMLSFNINNCHTVSERPEHVTTGGDWPSLE